MMFINHRRAESDAANATEGHEKTTHSAVCVSKVVRLACGAMVEAADQAEGGARSQLCARASLQFALCAALRHTHAQQLRFVPPRHAAHSHTMLCGHQVLRVALQFEPSYSNK